MFSSGRLRRRESHSFQVSSEAKLRHCQRRHRRRRTNLPLPVDDAAARPQVLRAQQAAVQREVLQEAGLALRRAVDVAVVADGQQRLQAVLDHAGHGHGHQPVRLVVLEDVAPLAVQQQHDGLRGGGSKPVNGVRAPPFAFFFFGSYLSRWQVGA